jgi:stress responsive alpha/beta barrel protein
MVLHVVLFRPKPDIADSDRQVMFDALSAAARDIPSVKRFQVGHRVTHGRPYERLMKEDFSYAAVVQFDDLAGLKAYLEHSAHETLGAKFMELLDVGLIYDYEVESLRG